MLSYLTVSLGTAFGSVCLTLFLLWHFNRLRSADEARRLSDMFKADEFAEDELPRW